MIDRRWSIDDDVSDGDDGNIDESRSNRSLSPDYDDGKNDDDEVEPNLKFNLQAWVRFNQAKPNITFRSTSKFFFTPSMTGPNL